MAGKIASFDVIVLGAGGAGLMCAARAGQRGRKVLVIDHADAPGKKILISGGGRCNFTNIGASAENFISVNPHFCKSALGRYTPQDFIELVGRYGIAWHEKTLGQLFCDGSARQIVDMLLDEAKRAGVQLSTGDSINQVSHADGRFRVDFGKHGASAPSLVIATGGPSIPKTGATGFAYELARQFGLKIVEPRPALVPLTLAGDDVLFRDLSGVATETIVSCGKTRFREASLFTHKGLSGPAVLQISSYWRKGDILHVDFLPDRTGEWLLANKYRKPKSGLQTVLQTAMPERLAGALLHRLNRTGRLGDFTDKALRQVEQDLHNWSFRPNGTEGFAKAEVTVGGISTAELSSKTMEAKNLPGLFAVGEAVDVTGWLGGYNFQWAWSSGVAAGDVV